ncbi:MAG: recombinase family protein [Chloracidobacterium sp.]|nr:recombinase family protein [Chloracidobacterium sp.]
MTDIGDQRLKSAGGIAPFGYRWKDGSLVVDPIEAPVRKLIFELFVKHKRKRVIAKILNDLGYRTRSGAAFSDTTIDRLLRDTTAKGLRIENGQEVSVEPIVSNELWQKANHLLGEKRGRPSVQLFAGVAFCQCGGKMFASRVLEKYACLSCKRKIGAADLEEILISQFPKLGSGTASLASLEESWPSLTEKEKLAIVEQLVSRITIGRTTIDIEFAVPAHSFKTPTTLQQNHQGTETEHPSRANAAAPTLNEPMMNEAEAARFLGISKMTLLRRRKAGQIGYYRVGFRVLYSKEKHLIPFLNECENRSG